MSEKAKKEERAKSASYWRGRGFGSGERGAFLLEMTLGLAIAAGLALFTTQLLYRYHQEKRERAAALYLDKLVHAARSWAGTRSFSNLVLSRSGSASTRVFVPFSPRLSQLKDEGFLPRRFPDAGPFSGAPRIVYSFSEVVEGGSGDAVGYVLEITALLEHGSPMARARAMRILAQVPTKRFKGGYVLGGGNTARMARTNGRQMSAENTALLSPPANGSVVAVMATETVVGGRTARFDFSFDREPLAERLGEELEKVISAWEERAWAHLAAQTSLGSQSHLSVATPAIDGNGVPTFTIREHNCPTGAAPQIGVFDANAGASQAYVGDGYRGLADERNVEKLGVISLSVRLPHPYPTDPNNANDPRARLNTDLANRQLRHSSPSDPIGTARFNEEDMAIWKVWRSSYSSRLSNFGKADRFTGRPLAPNPTTLPADSDSAGLTHQQGVAWSLRGFKRRSGTELVGGPKFVVPQGFAFDRQGGDGKGNSINVYTLGTANGNLVLENAALIMAGKCTPSTFALNGVTVQYHQYNPPVAEGDLLWLQLRDQYNLEDARRRFQDVCTYVKTPSELRVVRKCVITADYVRANPIRIKLVPPPTTPPPSTP